MKNHIKNYIKIMGLAAVPFGTAQAKNYEIKVTRENKPDADYFRISVGEAGKEPKVADIVWSHDKKHPNPIFEPNGFIRQYSEELRRRRSVLYVGDVKIGCERVCGGKWFGNYEINCFEWVRCFYKNEANSFEKLSKELLRCQFPYVSRDSWSLILCALNAGENGLKLAEDAQEKMKRLFKYGYSCEFLGLGRRCKLPNDCSYVCYATPVSGIWFFLVKDPRRCFGSEYILLINLRVQIGEYDRISVLSDVRTVSARGEKGRVESYCATNEILDPATRRRLCEDLLPGGFRYHLSDTAESFVRIISHANERSMSDFEKSMDGFKFLPRQCFEVESGRITGA